MSYGLPFCAHGMPHVYYFCIIYAISKMFNQIFLLLSAGYMVEALLPEVIKGKGDMWMANHTDTKVAMSGCILGEQNGCDTQVAAGLTNQIIAELGNMGYSFKALDPQWIHCSSACSLQAGAADSLAAAAASKNDYITLNSAFRSSAQQYMLYQWYNKGICGIGLAASPGSSNHEGGRAVDTSYYSYWLSTLEAHGWVHSYPSSDPVHFDCE
jgi:hypothetical protein